LAQILASVRLLEPERVGLMEAADRVLTEVITADRDIPPLTNSAMDGYAVRGTDLAQTESSTAVRLRVIGEVAAGHVTPVQVEPGTAVRIMTGAPVPPGADTVVRFEDTRPVEAGLDAVVSGSGSWRGGKWVEIVKAPSSGANVRQAGEDVPAGRVVLRPGHVLRPQEIGMLAAVGRVQVAVVRRPRVAILATGDEIVSPDQPPGPGQIRDANSYTIAAQVQRCGGIPLLLGVARDQEALVRRGMRRALAEGADLIITSGGVSVGDFDLVKQVLSTEGVMRFWSLNMKPGRPLAFGVVKERATGSDRGVPLLGLPGNPVAAMLSTELFARPALMKMQGFADWSRPTVRARLTSPIARKDGRRHYLRVRLQEMKTGYEADLTGDQGSGILTSLVEADGLAVIPEDVDHLPAGSEVQVILLR
jgi:molybdopterin molybdotransferase